MGGIFLLLCGQLMAVAVGRGRRPRCHPVPPFGTLPRRLPRRLHPTPSTSYRWLFFVRAGASFSFQSSFGECVCRYNNNSRLKCITSGREVMGRSMSTHFFHPPSPGNLSLAQKWSSSSSSGGGDAGLCNRSFPLGCWIRATFSLFDRSAACFWLEKKKPRRWSGGMFRRCVRRGRAGAEFGAHLKVPEVNHTLQPPLGTHYHIFLVFFSFTGCCCCCCCYSRGSGHVFGMVLASITTKRRTFSSDPRALGIYNHRSQSGSNNNVL